MSPEKLCYYTYLFRSRWSYVWLQVLSCVHKWVMNVTVSIRSVVSAKLRRTAVKMNKQASWPLLALQPSIVLTTPLTFWHVQTLSLLPCLKFQFLDVVAIGSYGILRRELDENLVHILVLHLTRHVTLGKSFSPLNLRFMTCKMRISKNFFKTFIYDFSYGGSAYNKPNLPYRQTKKVG